MQYTTWPDHGVPVNPRDFVKFVGEVRRARNGSIDPIIVHCSAVRYIRRCGGEDFITFLFFKGIGRTGVLIMMETAMCMIEANEPIYPLDMLRTMRDQRAMLIQTSVRTFTLCRGKSQEVVKQLRKSFCGAEQSYTHYTVTVVPSSPHLKHAKRCQP